MMTESIPNIPAPVACFGTERTVVVVVVRMERKDTKSDGRNLCSCEQHHPAAQQRNQTGGRSFHGDSFALITVAPYRSVPYPWDVGA